jgi:hypothetical protein
MWSFIKICPICIIGINRLKEKLNFNCSYMAMNSLTYIQGFSVKFFFQPIYTDYANWAYFDKRSHLNLLLWNRWTKLNQTLSKLCWTAIEEISISSNSSHLEWRAGLSDTILKGTHQGTIPARFGLIWFSGFRGEDLNEHILQNFLWTLNFCRFWPIMQIRKKGGWNF